MNPMVIDGWTIEPHHIYTDRWVAKQSVYGKEISNAEFLAYILGDSIFVEAIGNHEDPAFLEIPLTVIKKLLELK